MNQGVIQQILHFCVKSGHFLEMTTSQILPQLTAWYIIYGVFINLSCVEVIPYMIYAQMVSNIAILYHPSLPLKSPVRYYQNGQSTIMKISPEIGRVIMFSELRHQSIFTRRYFHISLKSPWCKLSLYNKIFPVG